MLSVAALAFILGLLLPRAEALAAALVVAASIVNGQSSVHTVSALLPVHYRQSWTSLFGPARAAEFGTWVIAQMATILLASGVAVLVLLRRDPTA